MAGRAEGNTANAMGLLEMGTYILDRDWAGSGTILGEEVGKTAGYECSYLQRSTLLPRKRDSLAAL